MLIKAAKALASLQTYMYAVRTPTPLQDAPSRESVEALSAPRVEPFRDEDDAALCSACQMTSRLASAGDAGGSHVTGIPVQ